MRNRADGLRSLNLSWCRKVTDRGIEALMDGCKLIRTVDIANCEALSADTITRLRGLNQRIEVVVAKKRVRKPKQLSNGERQKAVAEGPGPA